MRVADAQTGRPYSNHFSVRIIFPSESFFHPNHFSIRIIFPSESFFRPNHFPSESFSIRIIFHPNHFSVQIIFHPNHFPSGQFFHPAGFSIRPADAQTAWVKSPSNPELENDFCRDARSGRPPAAWIIGRMDPRPGWDSRRRKPSG
jgi:hypothetical protein